MCHERYHTEINQIGDTGTDFQPQTRNKEAEENSDRQTDRQTDKQTDKAGEGLAGVAEPAGSLGPFLGVSTPSMGGWMEFPQVL
ncbi:uncharacterized protein BO96DRAFT_411648, partial [Aspergillus niger CBS 101883]|uniref:uncharacterized protein n=1 Tax=Aspergillus lacticoffeatus (strain CBS 101883) TaxID=1450533 RepID=UPI000D8022F6